MEQSQYVVINGTSYELGTDSAIIKVLEEARKSRQRIRIFLGDPLTGECWPEEYDIMGYVGRSYGSAKIPLLVNNKRSMGGSGILTKNIVRITIDHVTVYENPGFHFKGEFRIANATESLISLGYQATVFIGNEEQASFKTYDAASRYIDFIKGEKNSYKIGA